MSAPRQVHDGSQPAEATDRARIVILGGGPAAVYLLRSFLQLARSGGAGLIHLTVVEKGERFGTGLPYDPHRVLPVHTLAFNQSVLRVDKGEELSRRFLAAVDGLREAGVPVELLERCEAVDVEPAVSSFRVVLRSGRSLEADHVVLATGHWETETPLDGMPGYLDSPWPARRLMDAVAPASDVALLGSSLTAVDAAKSIALAHGRFERRRGRLVYRVRAEGAVPRLTLYSRSGWLPRVAGWGASWGEGRPQGPARYERHLHVAALQDRVDDAGFVHLADVQRLLVDELRAAGVEIPCVPSAPDEALELLRRLLAGDGVVELRRSFERARRSMEEERMISWQALLWEKAGLFNRLYHLLPGEDRLTLRTRESTWMAFQAQLNFKSAEEMLALHDAGVLQMEALGRHYEIRSHAGGRRRIQVLFQGREKARLSRRHDLLVRAIGQAKDLEGARSPLLRSLLRRGLVQPALIAFADPSGCRCSSDCVIERGGGTFLDAGGVFVNPSTLEAIRPPGVDRHAEGEGPGLFVVGPLVLGQFLPFYGLNGLQEQAPAVVVALLRRVSGRR